MEFYIKSSALYHYGKKKRKEATILINVLEGKEDILKYTRKKQS